MNSRVRYLVASLLVFLVSAVGVLVALERASRALLIAAAIGMTCAAILCILSVWLPQRRVDWDRVRMEQRLWESGPLGRRWLRVRQRIFRFWKL